MDISPILQQLGLTERQVKVYLACLELGPSSVLQIAKKAGLKRPTVYLVLDELREKSLILEIPKKTTTFYVAEQPEKILEDLRKKEELFSQVLPSLKALDNKSAQKPVVKFYEGKAELRKLYEDDILQSPEIIFYGVAMSDFIRDFRSTFEKARKVIFKQNNTKLREIWNSDVLSKNYAKQNQSESWQIRLLPKELQFEGDNAIWQNKVAIISLKNYVAMVIESADVAKTHIAMFELAWQSAEEVK
jgi:HTH-type transcriptional regulator, sugar sensing transcriptional regulator